MRLPAAAKTSPIASASSVISLLSRTASRKRALGHNGVVLPPTEPSFGFVILGTHGTQHFRVILAEGAARAAGKQTGHPKEWPVAFMLP